MPYNTQTFQKEDHCEGISRVEKRYYTCMFGKPLKGQDAFPHLEGGNKGVLHKKSFPATKIVIVVKHKCCM